MKKAAMVFLVLLFTGGMIFLIQSSPAFALLNDDCSCVDYVDAVDACHLWCSMGDSTCAANYLLTPWGNCEGTQCMTRWKVICEDGDQATYWQYTDCESQCEKDKNPPIYTRDVQDGTPDAVSEQEVEINTQS